MTTTFFVLLSIFSISLNILLVWYIRKLVQEFKFMSDNVNGTTDTIGDFIEHLERLYELETYYGDTNLKSLIDHSKEVLEDIKEFESVISSINKEGNKIEEEEE